MLATAVDHGQLEVELLERPLFRVEITAGVEVFDEPIEGGNLFGFLKVVVYGGASPSQISSWGLACRG